MSWQRILRFAKLRQVPVIITDETGEDPMILLSLDQLEQALDGGIEPMVPPRPSGPEPAPATPSFVPEDGFVADEGSYGVAPEPGAGEPSDREAMERVHADESSKLEEVPEPSSAVIRSTLPEIFVPPVPGAVEQPELSVEPTPLIAADTAEETSVPHQPEVTPMPVQPVEVPQEAPKTGETPDKPAEPEPQNSANPKPTDPPMGLEERFFLEY